MDDDRVHEISGDECRKLLAAFQLGRIAFRLGDALEVQPVIYHAAGDAITIRTAPGTRLADAVVAPEVLVEIDHVGEREAWSVVGHGAARLLQDPEEVAAAEALGIEQLLPGDEQAFLRIDLTDVSGRRFHRQPL